MTNKTYILKISFDAYGNDCSVADIARGDHDENDLMSFEDIIQADLTAVKEEIGFLPDDMSIVIDVYSGEGKISDNSISMIFTEGNEKFEKIMNGKGFKKEARKVYHTYSDVWM